MVHSDPTMRVCVCVRVGGGGGGGVILVLATIIHVLVSTKFNGFKRSPISIYTYTVCTHSMA